MLVVKNGKVIMEDAPNRIMDNIGNIRADIGATSDEILPFGCSTMSTIVVIDKMDVIFSDGRDNWYREPDKPVPAGMPIITLFNNDGAADAVDNANVRFATKNEVTF